MSTQKAAEGKSGKAGDGKGLPGVRATDPKEVLAVLSSDWHLSLDPPPCRAERGAEWLKVQAYAVNQLQVPCHKHQCPLVIVGDVFEDGWREKKCPPELANFAIQLLRNFRNIAGALAVPGNHDLPNHSYKEAHRSAYQTLIEAGVLMDITYASTVLPNRETPRAVLHGYPCNHEDGFSPPKSKIKDIIYVAIIHEYVWHGVNKYKDAPMASHVGAWRDKLTGYNVAVFGDNHRSFWVRDNRSGIEFFNCGTLIRRKRDEISYRPQYGLLHADGTVSAHRLNCEADRFLEEEQEAEVSETAEVDVEELKKGLKNLGGREAGTLDFPSACVAWMKEAEVLDDVRRTMLAILAEEK